MGSSVGTTAVATLQSLLDPAARRGALARILASGTTRLAVVSGRAARDVARLVEIVRRYDPRVTPDGVGGEEETFSMCTFWLAEARARAGRLEEARLTFEKMLGYANHLGLYSEEIGLTGEALGNFPQAFTHLGLISAAVNISRVLDGNKPDAADPDYAR